MPPQINLGVVFTGEISAQFENKVRQLNRMLRQVDYTVRKFKTAFDDIGAGASGGGAELSKFSTLVGNLTDKTQMAGKVFSQLGDRIGTSEVSMKKSAASLQNMEVRMTQIGQKLGLTNKGIEGFIQRNLNTASAMDVLTGKLKITSTGFQALSENISEYSQNLVTASERANKVVGAQVTKGLTAQQEAAKSAGQEFSKFAQIQGNLANSTLVAGKLFREFGANAEYSEAGLKKVAAQVTRTEQGLLQTANAMGMNSVETSKWINGLDSSAIHADLLSGKLKQVGNGYIVAGRGASGASKKLAQSTKHILTAEAVTTKFLHTLKQMAYWGSTAAIIYGTINAIKSAVQEITGFDQSLKNLQAITTATSAQVMAMGDTIKQVAVDTKFSANEVADGMTLLGQAGFSATESISAIGAVSNLATGTLSNLRTVSDLLTTTIRAFNIDAKESARVSDVMATAINKSKLDVEKLRISFGYMAASASKAGISLEETAAATMVLANAGLRASTIGTSFRQILARLIAPNAKLRAAFEAAGADLAKMNPETNKFVDILDELAKVVPTSSRAFELFGLRAANAVTVLTQNRGRYREFLDAVYETGTASAMAEKQLEGLGAKSKQLADRIKVLLITLGEGGIGKTMGNLLDLFRWVTQAMITFASSGLGSLTITLVSTTVQVIALAKALEFLKKMLIGTALYQGILTITEGMTGMKAVVVTLSAALQYLSGVLSRHPLLLWGVLLGGLVTGLYKVIDGISKSAIEMEKQALETERASAELKNYYQSLMKNVEGSNEYTRTLKELAVAYKDQLGPYIDTVTGKWRNQEAGMAKLKSLMDAMNKETLSKQVGTLKELAKQAHLAKDPIVSFFTGIKTDEANKKLKEFTKTLGETGVWKELGIDASSSVESIQKTLQKVFPMVDFYAEQSAQVVKNTLLEMEEDSRDSVDKITNYLLKWAAELSAQIPTVYENIFKGMSGSAELEGRKIQAEMQTQLDQLDKMSMSTGLSAKAAAEERVKIELDTQKKLAEIVRDGELYKTQDQVLSDLIRSMTDYGNKMATEHRQALVKAAADTQAQILAAGDNQDEIRNRWETFTATIKEENERWKGELEGLWNWFLKNQLMFPPEVRTRLATQFKKILDSLKPKASEFRMFEEASLLPDENVTKALLKKQERLIEGSVKIMGNLWKNYYSTANTGEKEIIVQSAINTRKRLEQEIMLTDASEEAARQRMMILQEEAENLRTQLKKNKGSIESYADVWTKAIGGGTSARVSALTEYQNKMQELTDLYSILVASAEKGSTELRRIERDYFIASEQARRDFNNRITELEIKAVNDRAQKATKALEQSIVSQNAAMIAAGETNLTQLLENDEEYWNKRIEISTKKLEELTKIQAESGGATEEVNTAQVKLAEEQARAIVLAYLRKKEDVLNIEKELSKGLEGLQTGRIDALRNTLQQELIEIQKQVQLGNKAIEAGNAERIQKTLEYYDEVARIAASADPYATEEEIQNKRVEVLTKALEQLKVLQEDELKAVKEKYEKQINDAEGNKEKIASINEAMYREIMALVEAHGNQVTAAIAFIYGTKIPGAVLAQKAKFIAAVQSLLNAGGGAMDVGISSALRDQEWLPKSVGTQVVDAARLMGKTAGGDFTATALKEISSFSSEAKQMFIKTAKELDVLFSGEGAGWTSEEKKKKTIETFNETLEAAQKLGHGISQADKETLKAYEDGTLQQIKLADDREKAILKARDAASRLKVVASTESDPQKRLEKINEITEDLRRTELNINEEYDKKLLALKKKTGRSAAAEARRAAKEERDIVQEGLDQLEIDMLRKQQILIEKGDAGWQENLELEKWYWKQREVLAQQGWDNYWALWEKNGDNESRTKALQALQDLVSAQGKNLSLDIKEKQKQFKLDLKATADYTEEELRIWEKAVIDKVATQEEFLDYQRGYYKELADVMYLAWKRGEVGAEDYAAVIEKLLELKELRPEEAMEKSAAAMGTLADNINVGINRWKESVQSWGEWVQDFVPEYLNRFSDGMSNALVGFLDGIAEGKARMQDFFKSMLAWMAQVILKQTIMVQLQQMLNSMMGFLGLGGLGGGGGGGAVGGSLPFAHAGGIIGKDKFPMRFIPVSAFATAERFHDGAIAGKKIVGPNEVPAILEKGEGVFTKEQMEVLGKQSKEVNTYITNIVDPRMMDAYLASPRGRRAVINVIGSEPHTMRRLMKKG